MPADDCVSITLTKEWKMAGTKPTYRPGSTDREIIDAAGKTLVVPVDWALLAPGDAGMTRRVKAAGDHYVVQEKRGRKTFSRGVWAPSTTIERVRSELTAERSTDAYAKKQASAAKRREKQQTEYVSDFAAHVRAFLDFDASYASLEDELVARVTAHATPVGSGTVARTKRIPVESRAEAAVIAWMRHQTTAYDEMKIARVKGKRREVRRQLARRSHELLTRYRRGEVIPPDCPLQAALTTEPASHP